ncbi:hypothetical protein ACTVZO_40120 [Streptomyces sp. IBSNAI002]|uniref:hypothetical protein n=1 Tax=Streptomyces sp. IBSNAI002 TaxID=3457500 RepID=UPI003FD205D1
MPKPLPEADYAALRATGDDLKRAFDAIASVAALPPELAAELRAAFPAARGPAHDVYPNVPAELRIDLREALMEFFPHRKFPMPSAVTIAVTNDYDDGPAWNTYGATLHYGPDVTVEAPDFERTFVADALVEISDDEQPYGTPSPVMYVPLPA